MNKNKCQYNSSSKCIKADDNHKDSLKLCSPFSLLEFIKNDYYNECGFNLFHSSTVVYNIN